MARATPPYGTPAPDSGRLKLANGLYAWEPNKNRPDYWSQPLPITPAQAEHNRRMLDAPLRKDDRP